ncbi:MAG: DUF4249 family protein [Bacteroidota bacterium]
MNSYHLSILAILALFFSACTEVIEIEADQADSKVVIEATLTNTPLNNQVILTQSAGFYETGSYPRISDAIVKVIDEQGTEVQLTESEEGVYQSDGWIGQADQVYQLQVEVQGETYGGLSYLPEPIQLDSLSYMYESGSPFREAGFVPTVYFSSDRPESDTYVRFFIRHNGRLLRQYDLYNGNQPRGEGGSISFFQNSFASGDTLQIIAASIDKSVYDYYFQLAEITGNGAGPGAAAPSNPTSNLSNDALGYFGAMGISVMEEILP